MSIFYDDFDDLIDDSAFESMASALDRDEKKRTEKEDNKKDNFIDLNSLYKLYINEDALKKYEDQYRQLAHIDKKAHKLRGYMYFMNSTGKKGDLVAFVSVKLENGKTWVDTVEVTPKYRGNKISHQLLDVACNEFGATDIKVNASNEFALRVFKKYGFMEYDRKENNIFLSNDAVTTSNPVQKHDSKQPAKECYVDTFIKETCPECLLVANESLFGKRSREELIESAIKKVQKKCNTPEKKKVFKSKINDNERVYNATISSIKKLESKHSKGTISDKDYIKQKKMAMNLIHKVMIEFNININNFIDNKKQPTQEEIEAFGPIIKRIKAAIK